MALLLIMIFSVSRKELVEKYEKELAAKRSK